MADYAGEDAWLPLRLRPILAQKLDEADRNCEGREASGEGRGTMDGGDSCLPSPASGRGAGGEGGREGGQDQSQPALTLALSQGERGPDTGPLSPPLAPRHPHPSPACSTRWNCR